MVGKRKFALFGKGMYNISIYSQNKLYFISNFHFDHHQSPPILLGKKEKRIEISS